MAERPTVGRARAAREMFAVAWTADRPRAAGIAAISILEALSGSLLAWWLKLLTDAITAHDTAGAVLLAVALAVSAVATVALDYARTRTQQVLNDRAHHLIDRRLLSLVGGTPTLTIHQTPEHLTQLELLQAESWQFGAVIPSLVSALNTGVRVVVTAALLAAVDPLLLVLPVFGLPLVLLSGRTSGLFVRGAELSAEPTRRAEMIFDLATTSGPAKELRLFRLEPALIERFHTSHGAVRAIHRQLHLRGALLSLLARVIFLVGYVGAIVLVTWRAVQGQAGLGDVALTAVLCGQVLGLMNRSAGLAQWTLQTLASAARYVHLVQVAGPAPTPRPSAARVSRRAEAPPDRLGEGIRFDDVSFTYPGSERATITGLNLELPAGATVAIVGDNGAGKTTLVNLLAGMHRPTSGSITVDGIDLGQLDPQQWRSRVTAAFQDHARFEFLARETVGIGLLRDLDDEQATAAALERAGATDVTAALPDGLQTQLGLSWDGGVDLSGGQWQKLAIARAMMRPTPLLQLLDEPTAALDAESEYRLFTRWTEAASRARRASGTITVLISHRFSTVRMADLIVVLREGAVIEQGGHADLLARGGTYAELFELQARAYR